MASEGREKEGSREDKKEREKAGRRLSEPRQDDNGWNKRGLVGCAHRFASVRACVRACELCTVLVWGRSSEGEGWVGEDRQWQGGGAGGGVRVAEQRSRRVGSGCLVPCCWRRADFAGRIQRLDYNADTTFDPGQSNGPARTG